MKTKKTTSLCQKIDKKKANEIVSKEIIDKFNALLKNILKAWSLVAKQDVNGIKKLYHETEQEYTNISNKYDENITRVFKLLPNCIKISFHIAQGLSFNLVDKAERAFQEYECADERYNTVSKLFQQIENTMGKEFFSVFKFLLDFSCSIISYLKEDSFNTLQYKKGKYIDQVERFRGLAGRFRMVSSALARFNNKDKKLKDLVEDIHTFVVRVADLCDDNAGNIETNNKKTNFLPPTDNKVFIVHGHNTKILQELKEILKSYGIEAPVVLREMVLTGRTIIEKFEDYARCSGFTFVIITPDDLVENKGETYSQGRPNVLFELGWFYGRFGRGRVMILKKKGTKMPSDLYGIETVDFYKKLKEVSEKIVEELKHNGIEKKA